MTHDLHASHASPVAEPFTPVELQRLHREDVVAARVVAGLMTVIFLVGLALYAAIAYLVAV